jgi:hypothetical protein
MLAAIWAELLRLERVGRHENFFGLGGHSLLATQLISRVRESFHVELPLRALFEEPTVAGLAWRLDQAIKDKKGTRPPPLTRARREGHAPLSFAQQRLWFLHQLEPESPAYNIPRAMRLVGPLDVEAFRKALSEITRRHEVLRTTFVTVGGRPTQVVSAAGETPLPIIDLRELPEREMEARRLAVAEAARPFDLARGPLLRAQLIRLGEEEHVALLTTHHIISDGWSAVVLERELSALYEALSKGAESPLSELPVQYADYAVWQREWLTGAVLAVQLNYWKRRLAGAPPLLQLRSGRPRPARQGFRGARHSFDLPHELSERLKKLGRREGATMFMTLLAAFKTLLYRYSGQTDVVVGTPVAGRNFIETEGLIGFFVNSLALRTDLSGDPSFLEALLRVRAGALEAYAHQELPFEKLVEELRPERNPSFAPIFQVMFALQNLPFEELRLPGLTLRPVDLGVALNKFDLSLYTAESEQGLVATIVYDAVLFDEAIVSQMAGDYRRLLESVAADPEKPIRETPLAIDADSEAMIGEFNASFDDE